MKNSMKYISVATLMLAMASCENSDELNLSAYESDPNAVKINATIAGMTPQTRVNTEGNGDEWQEVDQYLNPDGDQIKVINTSVTAPNKKEGVYKYEGGKWTPQGTGYMVWKDGTNTFEAFYPYKEGTKNSFTQFEIPNFQSSIKDLRAADWMTVTTTTAKTKDKAVNLAFKHELVKVTMKIVKYNDQYDPLPDGLRYEMLNFTVPTITPIEGKTVTIQNDAKVILGTGDSSSEAKLYSFTAILPPGKFTAGDKVFELMAVYTGETGVTLTVNAPAESVLTTGLEAGKAYTFNLTVGKNKLTLGNVTVNEWEKGEAGNGGTAIENKP